MMGKWGNFLILPLIQWKVQIMVIKVNREFFFCCSISVIVKERFSIDIIERSGVRTICLADLLGLAHWLTTDYEPVTLTAVFFTTPTHHIWYFSPPLALHSFLLSPITVVTRLIFFLLIRNPIYIISWLHFLFFFFSELKFTYSIERNPNSIFFPLLIFFSYKKKNHNLLWLLVYHIHSNSSNNINKYLILA